MSIRDNEFYFHFNENTVTVHECQRKIFFYLLMILNVNRYDANVVLESSNEGSIGVNESILTSNETNLDTNE